MMQINSALNSITTAIIFLFLKPGNCSRKLETVLFISCFEAPSRSPPISSPLPPNLGLLLSCIIPLYLYYIMVIPSHWSHRFCSFFPSFGLLCDLIKCHSVVERYIYCEVGPYRVYMTLKLVTTLYLMVYIDIELSLIIYYYFKIPTYLPV